MFSLQFVNPFHSMCFMLFRPLVFFTSSRVFSAKYGPIFFLSFFLRFMHALIKYIYSICFLFFFLQFQSFIILISNIWLSFLLWTIKKESNVKFQQASQISLFIRVLRIGPIKGLHGTFYVRHLDVERHLEDQMQPNRMYNRIALSQNVCSSKEILKVVWCNILYWLFPLILEISSTSQISLFIGIDHLLDHLFA